MKTLLIPILSLMLVSCASTENETGQSDESLAAINNPEPFRHQEKLGGKEAAIGVALATTVGAISKKNTSCDEDCEQALKESLVKSTKYK